MRRDGEKEALGNESTEPMARNRLILGRSILETEERNETLFVDVIWLFIFFFPWKAEVKGRN